MDPVSYREAEVPAELRAQVWELQELAWPTGEPDPGRSHDPALDPRSMLLLDGGTVVAALDLLGKEITHGGQVFRARGLSAVVTDPARRGRGHGGRLVAAARAALGPLGADLGIFTCDRPLVPFYVRAGWQPLPGTVLVGGTPERPFPSDRADFDKVVLADFVTAHARAHRASFTGARVTLHPGEIDRLW
ncbi:GNAT family N-acetyltransferase [Kitasatospora sp. NPDC048540]|uniref:GNAT family N-acetyltransferase n=1 Tax=unclassified Kitasatospora TaxID=2633591 RepID=UPI00053B1200|nr:GNAT family N-acetyltransferase [Kitasatospora sp. MBT63]